MKLNNQPTLRAEDFPDFKEASKLFFILNPFINNVGQIFNQGIDYQTNFRSITQAYQSTGVTLPFVFSWPFPKFTPVSLDIVQAKVNNTPSILLAAWSFNASTSEVSITRLVEVTSAGIVSISTTSTYEFTVRVTI